ncbi:winged helix DNA-binding protein [Tateyamaria omphalii]|uniref:winged helix DNA-binding protein n=1 Tax=Tateyamaria omphalii TaxID=299262 RepID=UPI001C99311A|nr:winged helix DNA-binding protein [Tateyamaria omphalii]MBY5932712.1 winged helix DNA-binding protein [Tateyamaria omphalii]
MSQTIPTFASDPSTSELERNNLAVTNFEFAAWHLASAFAKWRRDCSASLPYNDLSGSETSILHIVHMSGTPKGLSDIARLLHRDDTANLQYGIKKLLSIGYVEKADGSSSRKLTRYQVTEEGEALVTAFHQRREEILLELTQALPGVSDTIEKTTNVLHVMAGLYEQASEIALMRSVQSPSED